MGKKQIKVLFSDLGGVLLTNGWDRVCRAKAVEKYGLDAKEFDSRHQMLFGDYEVGKITLETYLKYTVFYQPRTFSQKDFVDFMYAQSKPFEEMIELVKEMKKKHGLRLVAVSNEGKELTTHRVKTFKLAEFIDFFLVSCYIGIRKPDTEVYRMALDMVQAAPQETVYLDDRQLFVELAADMGIHSICHKDVSITRKALEGLLS